LNATDAMSPQAAAEAIRTALPLGGLFANQDWRISPSPFSLEPSLVRDLESLGRVLLQFYRAVNLLYRQSAEGKQPAWVADYLDRGKPADLIALQRSPPFKNEIPRVIRPDILLTDHGISITELDSVPGGIGLTAWLNQTYSKLGQVSSVPISAEGVTARPLSNNQDACASLVGGPDAMLQGFAGIFDDAARVHIVVSAEAGTYRPEMEWLTGQLQSSRFAVHDSTFTDFNDGDAVYRFFELFDLANVPNSKTVFELASQKRILLTPPPKPALEEKMLFALLWNRNLREFWRQHLGEKFFERLLKLVPYSWIVDPAPLPPHGAIPELNLTDWHQLKSLSQKQRDLILKVSGFSEHAWGTRGVYLGSDLSQAEWAAAVDKALSSFEHSPYVLQRYHHPRVVESHYFDFATNALVAMPGRVRLCPYYFVVGEGDAARAHLAGVLATICPADKKLIHGMKEAILAPCSV
jgi:hypothetical protein